VKLTQKHLPDASRIGWVSDVHLGIEHTPSLKLMCEAWEAAGVTHIVAGGDIADLHCLSTHPKDPERILAQGTIEAEIAPGRWFLDYLATRGEDCYYLKGNHEGRWDRFVQREATALFGNSSASLESLMKLHPSINVLPVGSELRLGNLVLTHLDNELPRGGGKMPAKQLLDMAPDQSTVGGHVHTISMYRRSTRDEDGIKRTRAAWTMGHMSREEKHHDYVTRHINWQMGFGIIDVWWDSGRPRWDVTQVEVMFDRKARPYFALHGTVYQ
jgi:hypothetical protein